MDTRQISEFLCFIHVYQIIANGNLELEISIHFFWFFRPTHFREFSLPTEPSHSMVFLMAVEILNGVAKDLKPPLSDIIHMLTTSSTIQRMGLQILAISCHALGRLFQQEDAGRE